MARLESDGYNGVIKQQLSTEVTKMSAASLYPVRPEVAASTLTDEATYKAMYQQSVVNPDGFWREQAKRLDWIKPFTTVKQTSFDDHHEIGRASCRERV